MPGYSEDEEETSNSSDGRKRSRTTVTFSSNCLRQMSLSSCLLLRAPLRNPSTCNPPSAPPIDQDPFSHSRNSRAHLQVGDDLFARISPLPFSVNIDEKISEFEFEFCLDSDGFIKNRDYKIPNYQVFSMSLYISLVVTQTLVTASKSSCKCSCP